MRYSFEAIDQRGVSVVGQYEAENEAQVSEYLQKRQLTPVSIKSEADNFQDRSLVFFERITSVDRITLVRNLAATTKAGLSIIEALEILAQDAPKPLLKKILLEMKNNMQNGQALWQSFQYYRKYFPPFFVGMVRAAESSGKLDTTLEELTEYLSREYNLVRKIKSAMAYPIILLIAAFGVIILMLTFVLPRMETTFQRGQIELPALTKFMIMLSHGLLYNVFLDIFGAIVLAVIFIFLSRNVFIKNTITKFLFYVPLVRNVLKKIVLVRFSRTLGSLLSSGALITDSLSLAADSVGNSYYKQAILKTKDDISKGISLSRALSGRGELFPKFLISLIIVGEKTGTLEHILKTFSDFYDEEVDYELRTLTTFLEPAMLLLMGLIIGFIVVSILLPVYQFVGKFI